jgi:hypothetical protein
VFGWVPRVPVTHTASKRWIATEIIIIIIIIIIILISIDDVTRRSHVYEQRVYVRLVVGGDVDEIQWRH